MRTESEEQLLERYAQANVEYLRMLYDCGHIERLSTDIPLRKAMISVRREDKFMCVIEHPDQIDSFRHLKMDSDIGASEAGWGLVPTVEQLHRVWNFVVRYHLDHGFSIEHMLKSLDQIPEWRAMRKLAR